jgi:hypothetical protein
MIFLKVNFNIFELFPSQNIKIKFEKYFKDYIIESSNTFNQLIVNKYT